jgi:glucose-6-phosphate 1-epimerase
VFARLTHANGSSAEVHLFGGQVTSFRLPSGDEVLFMRPDAKLDGSKPIAGGIPLCWPLFGPPPQGSLLAQHGFARTLPWSVVRTTADVNPDYPEPHVCLRLASNDATRTQWPHEFEVLLEVTLKRDRLLLEFKVRNAGAQPLDFTAAMHTYVEVTDAASTAVRVMGLQGCTFLDKVPDPKAPVRKEDKDEAIRFGEGLLDRVYLDTPSEVQLEVGTGAAVVVEHASGWKDTVVWNPHETLQPPCWRSFVCVESAVTRPVTLPAGHDWGGELSLYIVDL